MIITVVLWLLLVLVLGAGATFAIIAFFKPDRLMTWLAAGSVLLAVAIAWAAGAPAPVILTAVVALASTALAVFGGGPAAMLALQLATRGSVREGVFGGIVVTDDGPASLAAGHTAHEVLRGGTTIGVLERFAVVASIIAGFPEAIAVIVAVKGVGRFTELAASEARERFIIGTLASLTWACLCGAIVRLVLG